MCLVDKNSVLHVYYAQILKGVLSNQAFSGTKIFLLHSKDAIFKGSVKM